MTVCAAPILYVNHVSVVGGAEESLLTLMTGLNRAEFEPFLACPSGELAARATELGIKTLPLPATRFRRTHNPLTVSTYAVAWVAASNQFRKIVGEIEPRVIHANSSTAQLYAGSVAQKADIPCVWHARDLRPLAFPVRSLCRNANRVIAISEAVADFLAASGLSRPKVTRIYNAIDTDAWRKRVSNKDVKSELGLPPECRMLLIAAQMVPWKRHEDAIRAMPRILEKIPEARLVLAGADHFGEHSNLEDHLKAVMAELDIRDKVFFVGHRNDVPDLMKAAEIILIPSDAEPFGRVAIEAMALGKPVVGTRAGGLPEVVRDGETGLLVVPRFPESLGDTCARILENPSLAQTMGKAGRSRVEKHFPISRMVKETQLLYKAMLHPPLKWVRV